MKLARRQFGRHNINGGGGSRYSKQGMDQPRQQPCALLFEPFDVPWAVSTYMQGELQCIDRWSASILLLRIHEAQAKSKER